MAVVAAVLGADRKGNDGGYDEDEVHHHENGLELSHDLAHNRSKDPVANDGGKEDGVDVSVGRSPISITCDDNNRKKHQ